MKVFILGGTGSIGTAIVSELVRRSHQVLALSRSETADEALVSQGAAPIRGDMSIPKRWIDHAISCDAIVQVAATFEHDMAEVDAAAMSEIIRAVAKQPDLKRFIYTGGCWLYGETGNEVATEDRPFDPLETFSWMIQHAEHLLQTPNLSTAVIHPAMVYHSDGGGVFERLVSAAATGSPIEIWGSAETRWPLIERTDLACIYCDLLERSDLTGYFNAVAEEGVIAGEIVSSILKAYGSRSDVTVRSTKDVVDEHGAWAKGPTLDQQMSGQKVKEATGWEPKISNYGQSEFLIEPNT